MGSAIGRAGASGKSARSLSSISASTGAYPPVTALRIFASAGFQQQNGNALVLGQTIGNDATRGTGTDDNIVVNIHALLEFALKRSSKLRTTPMSLKAGWQPGHLLVVGKTVNSPTAPITKSKSIEIFNSYPKLSTVSRQNKPRPLAWQLFVI